MHLAIIEPDELTAHLLAFVARRRGHKSFVVTAGQELPERLPFPPAASIVAMDEISDESLRNLDPLRERFPDAPMLLTSEHVQEPAPLMALKAGISDVIRKPFHPHEVILRAEMQVANRGAGGAATSDTLTIGDVEIDLDRFSAWKAGTELRLTKLELRLLYCLMEHHGRVAPTERLLSFGWDSHEPPDASLLKTHISHLRQKLRKAGGTGVDIRSRHSLGYVLELVEE